MRARLIFDGDCEFCRYCVEYAQAVTGDDVEYRTYQDVGSEYPEITEAEFAASIQLFTDSGRSQGAKAAFETLAIGGQYGWNFVYQHVPGMAGVAEWLYRWVSTHRNGSYRLAKLIFGGSPGPRRHAQTADFLYRGIALCGIIAFASFWWQAAGLIGSDGILPVARYLDAVAATLGAARFWQLPTVFWVYSGDAMLHLVCAAGMAATVIGFFGRLRFLSAVVAYLCYTSLVHAGQVFMSYQWDILLSECFVLAAIVSRAPTLGIWVGRFLLFRFMFLSGAVKLLSGDPTWADGSALMYHFETQPLPTVFAWYAHRLPSGVLTFGVYMTFAIELVLAFFVFLPRNLRLIAGAGFMLLQLLIVLTGSYNFFNVLTTVLCIALLDDGASRPLRGIATSGRHIGVAALSALIIAQGIVIVGSTVRGSRMPVAFSITAPWLIANYYGLFAVMTTRRDELIVEGSMDGTIWTAYGFPFKPGPVDRAPVWATPYQPRLDWQMWFAALVQPRNAPWIYDFVLALLEARPAVLALIEDPFDGQRPKFIRIQRYRYHFSTFQSRAATGAWWERGSPEPWLGPATISGSDAASSDCLRRHDPALSHEVMSSPYPTERCLRLGRPNALFAMSPLH